MALQKSLQELEAARLITLLHSVPEMEFTFRHALIQEAAYRSLLRADRRSLHGQVARAIEQQYPDQIDQVAAMLAAHYEQAGQEEAALGYYRQAGDVASRTYANAEAAAHYRSALRLAQGLDAAESEMIGLSDSYGRALELTGRYEAAEQHYRAIQEWAGDRGLASLQLGAMAGRAMLYATLTPVHDSEKAQKLCDKILAISRRVGDGAREVQALIGLVHVHQYFGKTEKAFQLAQEAIAIARRLDLKEQLATILNDVSYGRANGGQLKLAEELLAESLAIWRQLGNLPMLANASSTLAGNHMYQGRYSRGLALAQEAIAIAERIEDRWAGAYGRMLAGGNYTGLGRYGQAIESLDECIRLSQSIGLKATEFYARRHLGLVYAEIGDLDLALSSAERALAIAEDRHHYLLLHALPVVAVLHLQRGDLDQAREVIQQGEVIPNRGSVALFNCFLTIAQIDYSWQTEEFRGSLATAESALETIEEFGLYSELPRVHRLQARALLALERDSEALTALERGRRAAQSMAAPGDLWPILYELSRLATRSGDEDKASSYLAQARAAIKEIIDDLPPDLKVLFLGRPRVREILSSVNRG